MVEMSKLSKALAEAQEHAAFTTGLQATQLATSQKELEEANEELKLWRDGSLRLSNMRRWREERDAQQRDAEQGEPGEPGALSAAVDEAKEQQQQSASTPVGAGVALGLRVPGGGGSVIADS